MSDNNTEIRISGNRSRSNRTPSGSTINIKVKEIKELFSGDGKVLKPKDLTVANLIKVNRYTGINTSLKVIQPWRQRLCSTRITDFGFKTSQESAFAPVHENINNRTADNINIATEGEVSKKQNSRSKRAIKSDSELDFFTPPSTPTPAAVKTRRKKKNPIKDQSKAMANKSRDQSDSMAVDDTDTARLDTVITASPLQKQQHIRDGREKSTGQ